MADQQAKPVVIEEAEVGKHVATRFELVSAIFLRKGGKKRGNKERDDPRNYYVFHAEKQSSSAWAQKWQPRTFALTRFGTLEYYQNAKALREGK
eukprot:1392421-Amorphochlora_amoeboformis.AAC.2